MIQDNFTLLLCLVFLVISCIVYQYFEITKNKKASLIHIENIQNKIVEEQLILNQKNNEVVNVEESEKEIYQNLKSIKTKIVTLDFSLKELIECITIS